MTCHGQPRRRVVSTSRGCCPVDHAAPFLLGIGPIAPFIVLARALVPATSGAGLEKIERNLMAGKRLRGIGT